MRVRYAQARRAGTVELLCATLLVACAALLGLSISSGFATANSWYDEQRYVATATMLLLAVCCSALTWRRMTASYGRSLLLGVLLAGLASEILAKRADVALLDWSLYAACALVLVFAPALRPRLLLLAAAALGVLPAAMYCSGVVAQYLSALALGTSVGNDVLLVSFANPRFPGQLQALTLVFMVAALHLAPSALSRRLIACIAGLWWMCFFGSGSRTAWLALGVTALTLVLVGPAGRRVVSSIWPAALAGLALYLSAFGLIPWFLDIPAERPGLRLTETASVSARLELWHLALRYASSDPLLGVGPMHFSYHFNEWGAHPHNFLLQLAAEWGLGSPLP